jgi:hypothetical protein
MPVDRKDFDEGNDPKMRRVLQFLTASYNAFTPEEVSAETRMDIEEVTAALGALVNDRKVELKVIQKAKYYAAIKQ